MIARRALIASASLAALAVEAAEPVRVLSGGALEPAVAAALRLWRSGGRAEVAVTFATAPRIAERLAAGERPDLVLAPVAVIEGLERGGRLTTPSTPLGSVGVGVAIRDGGEAPPIHDAVSLKAALLAADAVVFNRASTGLYMERLLARLGLDPGLEGKAVRFPDGEGVLRRIASGRGREIAFAAMTEILLFRDEGVRLVGPLPDEVQNRTAYSAGLLVGTGDDAREFFAFLGSAAARTAMRDAGVE